MRREAEMQAKKARTKIGAKTVQAFVGAGRGCNDDVASALPGVALTRDEDSSVHATLRRRRFCIQKMYMNFYMYAYICVYIHIYMHIHINTHMHTHVYIYVCV